MGRPKPVEYSVRWWDITWQAQYFDSSRATGECHYRANVSYIAKFSDDKSDTKDVRKIFQTFEEAKAWIDEELAP